MTPTGGPALETLVHRALEQYPTCGVAPRLLRIASADAGAPDRIRETMRAAGIPFDPRMPRAASAPGLECEFAVLQSAALATAVIGVLAGPVPLLDARRFWRHSAAVGVLSAIVDRPGTSEADTAFPAGICYALGRILLARLCDDRFGDVLRLCRESGMEVNAAERAALGVTEAELGSAVARRWGFPSWLVDAIARPRTQDSTPSEGRGTIASVFPARLAAASLGYATEVEAAHPPPRRLRWLIDPVLLRVEAHGGADWLATRVDGILAGTPADGEAHTP